MVRVVRMMRRLRMLVGMLWKGVRKSRVVCISYNEATFFKKKKVSSKFSNKLKP